MKNVRIITIEATMKTPDVLLNIGNIRWVDLIYKTGFKPAFEYNGWDKLLEFVKHKKGRKPVGFRFYSNKGIYLLTHEQNHTLIQNS